MPTAQFTKFISNLFRAAATALRALHSRLPEPGAVSVAPDEWQRYRADDAAIEQRYAHAFTMPLQEIEARAKRLGVTFAAGNALDRRYKLAILDWIECPERGVPLNDKHMSWFRGAATADGAVHPVDAARDRFLRDRYGLEPQRVAQRTSHPPQRNP